MLQLLHATTPRTTTRFATSANVIGLTLFIAFSSSAFAVVTKSDEASLEQLGVLAAAQQDSLAKIQSYELTMTEQFSYNSSTPDVQSFDRTTEHHERTQGMNTWVVRTEETSSKDTNHAVADKAEERLVANDRYVAYWPVGTAGAFAREYESSASMPEHAVADTKALNARSAMRYGFGDGELTLAELFERASGPDKVRLHVEKIGSMYLVTYAEGGSKLSEAITVDPAKGFLVTRTVAFYNDNGAVARELAVEPKEVTTGVWFPGGWEVTNYNVGANRGVTLSVRDHTRTEISSIAINPAFADETFKLSAINLEPTVRICVKDTTGAGRPTFLSQNEFVMRASSQKVASAR